MRTKRKKSLTLLEIMIVIFLIAMIGSVVGFNMKKSMDKAKQFKTNTAKQQLEDILHFILSEGQYTKSALQGSTLAQAIEETGLVKKASDVLYDGWGEKFKIHFNDGEVIVSSSHTSSSQDKETKAQNQLSQADEQEEAQSGS